LAHYPVSEDHAQVCIPLISENLDEVGYALKESHFKEIGIHKTVQDRFLDVVGKIEDGLRTAESKSLPDYQDAIKGLREKLGAVRRVVGDPQLVENWNQLARKLDDDF
jgi:hypothetical protein